MSRSCLINAKNWGGGGGGREGGGRSGGRETRLYTSHAHCVQISQYGLEPGSVRVTLITS